VLISCDINYYRACNDGKSASMVNNNGDPIRIASKAENMDLPTGSKQDDILDPKHLKSKAYVHPVMIHI
jgi:hypothetical protein